jgi:hypothetical protein
MTTESAGILIGLCAFILSLFTYWKTNILKPKLIISTSNWAIQQIKGVNGEIHPTFLVKINAYNKSGLPAKLLDIMIVMKDEKNKKYLYRPLLLFDAQKSIEVGKDIENFGKSQKGLVPLPKIIKPYEDLDFGYQIMFVPLITDNMYTISEGVDGVKVFLYYSSDRNKGYELITTQNYSNEQLLTLRKALTYAIENEEILLLRNKLL